MGGGVKRASWALRPSTSTPAHHVADRVQEEWALALMHETRHVQFSELARNGFGAVAVAYSTVEITIRGVTRGLS